MKLSWKIYSFLYALMVILGSVYALLPDSDPNVYYKILISFDKIYLWQYIFHYFSVFLEVFGLVPLFLFVFRKNWLIPVFWKVFFFVKIFGIFMGNSYQANLLGSFFAANKFWASVSILLGAVILLPYYTALYLYAFRFFSSCALPLLPRKDNQL